ncbi:Serine/threonine-protein kinase DCLK1, partial [Fragariocoptes setiger]
MLASPSQAPVPQDHVSFRDHWNVSITKPDTPNMNDKLGDISNSRYCKLVERQLYRYRARRLRFLINGDKFFTGINYALNTEKIRSFEALLNDLTRALGDNISLSKGVRYIFDLNGHTITTLDDFQEGNTYICSSVDSFTTIEYQINNGLRNWLVRNSASISRPQLKRPIDAEHDSGISKQDGSRSPSIKTRNGTQQCSIEHASGTSRQSGSAQVRSRRVHNTSVTQSAKANILSPKTSQKTASKEKNRTSNNTTKNNHDASLTGLTFQKEVTDIYDIGRPIGDGHFSIVYCCMNKSSQTFRALKLIDKVRCTGKEDMIYNEVNILKRLKHNNIVTLIEEFDYPLQLYLILELVQDGDLFDAISNVTSFPEYQVATMIYNLSSALTYLHAQKIAHRDIKPENLLISIQEDGSQSVKLADFGLAVEVTEPLYTICGTAFYVSPEMLSEQGYDYKVDVWSAGVICFILLCGYPPFSSQKEDDQDELFDAILSGEFSFYSPFWDKISVFAKDLIRMMLKTDPNRRITAEDVFKNPWTRGETLNFKGTEPMNMSRLATLASHESK